MEVSLGVRMVHYSCIGLYLNTMCKFKVIIPPGLAGPMSVLGVGPVSQFVAWLSQKTSFPQTIEKIEDS